MDTFSPNEQHIWHHQEQATMRLNVTLEKNSKGYNFSVVVVNAPDCELALDVLDQARSELANRYGDSELLARIEDLTGRLNDMQEEFQRIRMALMPILDDEDAAELIIERAQEQQRQEKYCRDLETRVNLAEAVCNQIGAFIESGEFIDPDTSRLYWEWLQPRGNETPSESFSD